MSIDYIMYTLRWKIFPVLVFLGGIYILLDFRYTELFFLISFIGIISLTYQASINCPSYSDYLKLLPRNNGKTESETVEIKEEDELYNKAKEIVINSGKSSASFLQRELNIGYASAAKLQEALEEKGVIGKYNGANQRDVLAKKGE